MRVLINAISIREGGSKVALLSFLRNFADCHEHIFYISIIDSALSCWDLPISPNLIYISAKWPTTSFINLFFWYNIRLPFLVRKYSIDVLFSLTNYLPILPVRTKSLLLVQHAGHFSSFYQSCLIRQNNGLIKYLSFRLKSAWVYLSIYNATSVTVQTEALRRDIISTLNICPAKIHVIQHGPGLVTCRSQPRSLAITSPVYAIGYIAKPGVQKNFFPLIRSLQAIQAKGIDVELHLTMPDDHSQTRAIMAYARRIGVEYLIVNHGDIGKDRVNLLYSDIDLFVFPSLCESFGFPLVEAMCSALPIIVSDTSSNLELAPSGALSFAPHDSYGISARIIELLSSPTEYFAASKASLTRSLDFSWETTSLKTIQLLQEL